MEKRIRGFSGANDRPGPDDPLALAPWLKAMLAACEAAAHRQPMRPGPADLDVPLDSRLAAKLREIAARF